MKNRILSIALIIILTCALFSVSKAEEVLSVPAPTEIINILNGKYTEQSHPRILATQKNFDDIKENIKTDGIHKNWYQALLTEANELLTAPLPVYEIPDGKRLLDTSRMVKERVLTLAMAWKISGEEEYAARAADELITVANFPDWNPSHFLDVGEMAFAAAVGYDWLYDYLIRSENLSKKEIILNSIIKLALEEGLPYLTNGTYFASNDNNWNLVCNGGLATAAFAVAMEAPEISSKIISKAIEHMPKAIEKFSPGGGYPEGPGYWDYATEYFVYFLSTLAINLDSDYGLTAIEGVDLSGYFALYLTSPIGKTFNFADGGNGALYAPQLYWMAEYFNKPVYAYAQMKFKPDGGALDLLWYKQEYHKTPVQTTEPLDRLIRNEESVAAFRGSWEDKNTLYAALLAGDNQSGHGDLDIGNFILDANGVRWATDLGAETYDIPGYWDSDANAGRWNYYRKRAEGHNTIVINPSLAPDQNVYAKAAIDYFDTYEDGGYAITDMTEAYQDSALSVKRGLKMFDNRSQILVQDEIILKDKGTIYWFMQNSTNVTPLEDGRTLLLSQGGKHLKMRIAEPADAVFTVSGAKPLGTSPKPDENDPNNGINRISIKLENTTAARIGVIFTPLPILDEQSNSLAEESLAPLETWHSAKDVDFVSYPVNGSENIPLSTQTVKLNFTQTPQQDTLNEIVLLENGAPIETETELNGNEVLVKLPQNRQEYTKYTVRVNGVMCNGKTMLGELSFRMTGTPRYVKEEFDVIAHGINLIPGINNVHYATPGNTDSSTYAMTVDTSNSVGYCGDTTRIFLNTYEKCEIVFRVPEGIFNFRVNYFDAFRLPPTQGEIVCAVSSDGINYSIPKDIITVIRDDETPTDTAFKSTYIEADNLPAGIKFLRVTLKRQEGDTSTTSCWTPKMRSVELNYKTPSEPVKLLGMSLFETDGVLKPLFEIYRTSKTPYSVFCIASSETEHALKDIEQELIALDAGYNRIILPEILGEEIKLYVWKDIDSMLPLYENITIQTRFK